MRRAGPIALVSSNVCCARSPKPNAQIMRYTLLLSIALLGACGDDSPIDSPDLGTDISTDSADAEPGTTDVFADTTDTSDVGETPFDAHADGPWTASVTMTEATVGERTLPVAIWGPTEAAPTTVGAEDLVRAERAEEYAALLDAAPEGCPSTDFDAAPDGDLADGPWPLIVYSHCHECLGLSGASVAARLASWGYIVLVPDHVGNTLWDQIDGTNVELGSEFLEVRGADVIGLIDAALSGAAPFEGLEIDADSLGVVGHSFGAVTAGLVAERDDRVHALVALAAPVENPLIAGVTASNIEVPTLMLVAVEDNSITEFGNTMMRTNYEALAGSATKVELADAGHWSVSDLCGVVEMFMPGCGEDSRQTDGTAFTYLSADDGREAAAAWVAAHFHASIREDADAVEWISNNEDDGVEVETRAAP